MKDPAFLFYSSDFLTGVQDLTMEERGQYITLLCIEHQKGRLSEKTIRLSCGKISNDLLKKFEVDEAGLYYNERLEIEMDKRAKHSGLQSERAKSGWEKRKNNKSHGNATASATAMPLVNEIAIRDKKESVREKEGEIFDAFRKAFPGAKGGLETEFTRFKKHKDWKSVLPFLMDRLNAEKTDRVEKKKNGGFIPEWANLSTYLNQRRWERYESENIPEVVVSERKLDLSISRESENISRHEEGRQQIRLLCHSVGYNNCSKKELQWAYDFQHPFGIVIDTWADDEILTDRGLPGTLYAPNTLSQVMGNG